MKKLLVSFIFVLGTFLTFSQGNLQFNQVLKVIDVDQTVPAGKVWKVESYHQQTVGISTNMPTTGCGDLSRPRPYYVDNVLYHHVNGIGNGNSSYASAATNEFPLWLKESQMLRTSCPGDFLSVLEFNIVP
jgi:hypothetical protein